MAEVRSKSGKHRSFSTNVVERVLIWAHIKRGAIRVVDCSSFIILSGNQTATYTNYNIRPFGQAARREFPFPKYHPYPHT